MTKPYLLIAAAVMALTGCSPAAKDAAVANDAAATANEATPVTGEPAADMRAGAADNAAEPGDSAVENLSDDDTRNGNDKGAR